MAQGDGFHVKEADVHLCLDVYPLPDLEQTEQCERASPPESSATFPPALLRHPLRSSRRWNPVRSVEEKLPSAFLLVNWADIWILYGLSQQVIIKYRIQALS